MSTLIGAVSLVVALLVGLAGLWIGVVTAVTALLAALLAPFWTGRDAVTVTPSGIQPTGLEDKVVPAAYIERIEVRSWSTLRPGERGPTWSHNLSLTLTDGRHVMLLPLRRSELDSRSCRVMVSTSERPEWEPLMGDFGGEALWRRITDADITTRLARRFDAMLDRTAAPEPERLADLSLHTIEGRTGKRYRTGASGRVDRTSAPRSDETHHVAVPHAATAPRTGDALPRWSVFPVPARYWSSVSRRAPSFLGRRPELRFAPDGVVLARILRSTTIPYAVIDRFIVGQGDSGVWGLGLRRTDGRLLELPGCTRGTRNALHWCGADPGKQHAEQGSFPWGPDDDDLVAGRLNAHLEAARRP